jgi:predicted secreted protein
MKRGVGVSGRPGLWRAGLLVFLGASIVLLTVSGCVATPNASPSPTRTPGPVATPTPTVAPAAGVAPLPAGALFQINAVATASNGAIADLVMTASLPTAAAAGQVALLDAQCNYPGDVAAKGQPSWESQYPRTVYMNTTIIATARAGTPAWPNATDPLSFAFLPVSAYTGAFTQGQSPCAAGLLTVPGTVVGVAPLWGSNPALGPYGWATPLGSYGFSGGGNDPGGPNPGPATVTDCTVQLSPTASAASASVAGWPTRAYIKQTGCVFVG